MDVRDGFSEGIRNTPLVRLRKASALTGCTILGKAELMNPGGVIVEGTAGNTGFGLALAGNARGDRTVIAIPETQSQEKRDLLRFCGAELREVPAVPFRDPDHYVRAAERLAKELADSEPRGVLYASQWDNLANRNAHFTTTGPEIWRQSDGRVDGFVCAIGTGGTLAGVGAFLMADSGARYQSKLFDLALLRSKELPVPGWLERSAGA